MKSHRSILAWSFGVAFAATVSLPAAAQMGESDREWIEASIRNAVRPFEERAAAVDRKKDEESAAKHAQDQAYLDDWALSFLLGSLKLSADGTYTNIDQWKGGPGLGPSAATEIDKDTFLYGAQIGWSAKPFLRDIYLLLDHWSGDGGTGAKFSRLEQYREWGKTRGGDSWKRWALLDAFTMTAGVRFGSVVDDPSGDGNSTTSQEGSYSVGVAYALPLEKFRSPFKE